MIDVNSKEYKLVMSLYENGKISEEERDGLIAALAEEEECEKSVVRPEIDNAESESGSAARDERSFKLTVRYEIGESFDTVKLADVCANVAGVENVKFDAETKTVTLGGDFDNTAAIRALEGAGVSVRPMVIDFEDNGRKLHIDFYGESMHVDINDKPITQYLKDAVGKVTTLIGRGVKSVGNAGGKIIRAAGSVVHAVGDFFTDLTDKNDEDN